MTKKLMKKVSLLPRIEEVKIMAKKSNFLPLKLIKIEWKCGLANLSKEKFGDIFGILYTL